MVNHCTRSSYSRGEFSRLAIAETVSASALSIYAAITWGTLAHLALGLIIAPILLLRTERSAAITLAAIRNMLLSCEMPAIRETDSPLALVMDVLNVIPTLARITVHVVVFKIYFTAREFVINPVAAIRAIPANWIRVAFVSDLTHPPELIPGIDDPEMRHEELHFLRFSNFIRYYREITFKKWFLRGVLGLIPLVLSTLIFYVPPMIYRWSIKATALIYTPLVWVIQSQIDGATPFRQRLRSLVHSPIEGLSRWYSWLNIALNSALLAMVILYMIGYMHIASALERWQSTIDPMVGQQIMRVFLWATPSRIEVSSWHLSRLACSVITVSLYYFCLAELKSKRSSTERSVSEKGVALALFSRSVLGTWTMLCSMFILVTSVDWPLFYAAIMDLILRVHWRMLP